MGSQWSQFFPPNPDFSIADLKPQDSKIFIVTGGASGIGFQVSKALYEKNGTVYIAGRSEDKATKALEDIRTSAPNSKGRLEFLFLDLQDLASVKASAEQFLTKESKLHVLWNNAGVSQPQQGSVSKQGFELQLATNCLGPFLFTSLLLPVLEATAAAAAEVGNDGKAIPSRVVWLSSQIVELSAPKGGLVMDEVRSPTKDKARNYTNSKTGNWFLSSELARRKGSQGIISVALNPGAASTNLFRHTPWLTYLAWPLLHKPELAALTELYAGLSPDLTLKNNGSYVIPWGRISSNPREDIVAASKLEEDGGTGRAVEFWDYCAEQTAKYM